MRANRGAGLLRAAALDQITNLAIAKPPSPITEKHRLWRRLRSHKLPSRIEVLTQGGSTRSPQWHNTIFATLARDHSNQDTVAVPSQMIVVELYALTYPKTRPVENLEHRPIAKTLYVPRNNRRLGWRFDHRDNVVDRERHGQSLRSLGVLNERDLVVFELPLSTQKLAKAAQRRQLARHGAGRPRPMHARQVGPNLPHPKVIGRRRPVAALFYGVEKLRDVSMVGPHGVRRGANLILEVLNKPL